MAATGDDVHRFGAVTFQSWLRFAYSDDFTKASVDTFAA